MLYWVKQISNPSSISIQNPIPVIPQFQSIIQCSCQNIFAIWGKFHKTEKLVRLGFNVWFRLGFKVGEIQGF